MDTDWKNDEHLSQYNRSFPVEAALIDNEIGPKQVLPPRLYSSQILDLADRVHAEVSINFEKIFPSKTYAEVVKNLSNNREI